MLNADKVWVLIVGITLLSGASFLFGVAFAEIKHLRQPRRNNFKRKGLGG